MSDDEKDDDGLTVQEREYLTTPMSQLSPEDRMAAIHIREKRDNSRWARNAEERVKEQKKNANAFA